MATTCKLIAKSVLGSSASSISFTSIPGTYTDLMLVCSLRATNTAGYASLHINGSNSSQSSRILYGSGSAAGSITSTDPGIPVNESTKTADTFASGEIYIPNYAGSTNKSWSSTGVQETNATAAYIYLTAGLWSNTAAITSLSLVATYAGNLAAGSSAYLYGLSHS